MMSTGAITAVKTRVIARNQQVVRVDRERPAALTADQFARARLYLEETIGGSEHGLALPTDVTSQASVNALFTAAVDRFGRVDLLFNNALHTVKSAGGLGVENLIVMPAGQYHDVEPVTDERIRACADLPQLDAWLDRAVTATSVTDLFE